MLHAYRLDGRRLVPLDPGAPLAGAIWVDLYRPLPEQAERVQGELGLEVPSLADMEEIEVSNRLYREDGVDAMTVVLPGRTPADVQVSGPVAFLLTRERLVTVRHHAPRPFETFGARADRSSTGCVTPERLFLGLVEEVVARLADLLEVSGRALDAVASRVYARPAPNSEALEAALRDTGREGEALARVRLGLLTTERMLSVWGLWIEDHADAKSLKAHVKTLQRDMAAMEVHVDFLSGRVALASDLTLGMVNLAQNQTVRIVSVVSVLFLPPTVVGTVYGMNFERMPELSWAWGYPMALGLMLASALGTLAFFRWKGWL